MDLYNIVDNFNFNVFKSIKTLKIRQMKRDQRNAFLLQEIDNINNEIKKIDEASQKVDSIIESTDVKSQLDSLNKELTILNNSIIETNKKGKADKIASGVSELNQSLQNMLGAIHTNQEFILKKEVISNMREDAEERLRQATFKKVALYDEPILGINMALSCILTKSSICELPNFINQYNMFNKPIVFEKILEGEMNIKRSMKKNPSLQAVTDFLKM